MSTKERSDDNSVQRLLCDSLRSSSSRIPPLFSRYKHLPLCDSLRSSQDGWPRELEAFVGPGLSGQNGAVEGIRMEDFPESGWTCYIIKKSTTRCKDVIKYQHPSAVGGKALGEAAFTTFSKKEGALDVDAEVFVFQVAYCLAIYKSSLEDQAKAIPNLDGNASSSTPPSPPPPKPAPKAPASPPVPTARPPGIANLGATCYLNSLLQCLFQNVPFRDGLYQYSSEQHPSTEDKKLFGILSELQVLFSQLETSVKGCLELKEVRAIFTALFVDSFVDSLLANTSLSLCVRSSPTSSA